MLTKGIKKLGLMAMMCCLPASLSAQVALNADVADSVTKKKTRKLDPVIVKEKVAPKTGYVTPSTSTATKTNTLLRDIPASITVVTKDLIKDQSMQTMTDAMRYVPGITMGQGEGHRDAPTIRGNSSTADFFVDGVRDDAQYFRDLYNSERVEGLKGSNAMIFGRGGGGGVINRVTKQAQWSPVRELTLQGGSYGNKRSAIDVGQAITDKMAVRFNGMYENSDVFRNEVNLKRYGINPTATYNVAARTSIKAGYEFFDDYRTVDRGIPSFRGGPSSANIETFFGNPGVSYADARVHMASAMVDHTTIFGLNVRNSTRYVHYDKFYQNVFPGAVDTTGTEVTISGYNNTTKRANLFNQTDLTADINTGFLKHTFLFGAEIGRQISDNFRNTAYFNGTTATSVKRPFADPLTDAPVVFNQSANDADNHGVVNVRAGYIQDQITIIPQLQAIVGVRAERFEMKYRNNRNGQQLNRDDRMLSPRFGLIAKPVETLSLYGGYSVSYLPSSGDQFSSLTLSTQTLDPEQFRNYEIGAKWDVLTNLAFTAAGYKVQKKNTAVSHPTISGVSIQIGEQVTRGYEFGIAGNVTSAWEIAGGFATQNARLTSTTDTTTLGNKVPLVPQTTLSLWNKYKANGFVSAGLGVVKQARMHTSIDNKVTLPSFTRVDGALYFNAIRGSKVQLNVENIFNKKYYPTSHGNNNILPGTPRSVRVSLTTGF